MIFHSILLFLKIKWNSHVNKSRFYRDANMSRENVLDLLGGLMRGGVPDSGEDYITQLEDSIHMGDLTSANLTLFMRNVML